LVDLRHGCILLHHWLRLLDTCLLFHVVLALFLSRLLFTLFLLFFVFHVVVVGGTRKFFDDLILFVDLWLFHLHFLLLFFVGGLFFIAFYFIQLDAKVHLFKFIFFFLLNWSLLLLFVLFPLVFDVPADAFLLVE
jgi:hypothetical protein